MEREDVPTFLYKLAALLQEYDAEIHLYMDDGILLFDIPQDTAEDDWEITINEIRIDHNVIREEAKRWNIIR